MRFRPKEHLGEVLPRTRFRKSQMNGSAAIYFFPLSDHCAARALPRSTRGQERGSVRNGGEDDKTYNKDELRKRHRQTWMEATGLFCRAVRGASAGIKTSDGSWEVDRLLISFFSSWILGSASFIFRPVRSKRGRTVGILGALLRGRRIPLGQALLTDLHRLSSTISLSGAMWAAIRVLPGSWRESE